MAEDGHNLSMLPDEIGAHILSHLPMTGLGMAMSSCVTLARWGASALARVERIDCATFGVRRDDDKPPCAFLRAALAWVATRTPRLRHVALTRLGSVVDDCLGELPASVVSLDLSGSCVTAQGLENAACACPRLAEVLLRACPCIDDAAILVLVTGCTELRAVSLSGNLAITDRSVAALSSLAHLERLGLNSCALSAEGIRGLGRCTQLTTLDVGRVPSLTDSAFEGVAERCAQLNVSGCALVSDRLLARLARSSPGLERLMCGDCPRVTRAGILGVCAGCPRLAWLHVRGSSTMDEACLYALAKLCPRLESLDVRGCERVTPGAIECFFNALRREHPYSDPRRIQIFADDDVAAFASMAAALVRRRRPCG
jgi:hypothetical protein